MENNERLKMARKFVREHGKIGFRTLLAMLGQDVSCGKIGSEFGIDLYTVARYKLHFRNVHTKNTR
jgi:hypothetical protein